jgi:hypothetical protein
MDNNLNKRLALCIFLYINLMLFPVNAIESIEINNSIVRGVEWLLDQQNVEMGSWGEGYPVAITGLAVLVMEEKAVKLDNKSPFESIHNISIKNGLNYIFTHSHDFDVNGDGVIESIYFCSPGSEYSVYETGIAMMAIAASLQPDTKVVMPHSSLNGKSYHEVEQMALNYLKFAQKENGGWTYSANKASNPDNSNTGYAILGIDYARDKFKISIPDEVKSRLNSWIDYLDIVS